MSASNQESIVVVGGGIVGLSIALSLARAGAAVTLLERGELASEASWAAAGMLAPLAEADSQGPFLALGLASRRAYDSYLQALFEDSGAPAPEITSAPLVRLAFNGAERAELNERRQIADSVGVPTEILTGDNARRREPAISDACVAALFSSTENAIDPRALCQSLIAAAMRRGVDIRTYTQVNGLRTRSASRRCMLSTTSGDISAGRVVLCGGAWTSRIVCDIALPEFSSRKGQLIAFDMPLGAELRSILYVHGTYIVPR
jgi:glycine oxidase